MTEEELIRRLEKIERLFAQASTAGERAAAASARHRMQARVAEFEQEEPAVEYKFSLPDKWSRRLFLALLRRHQLTPYRYSRQRRTTVMARVSKTFVDTVLWPEFRELNRELETYISEVTERIIRQHVFEDASEASVMPEPKQLEG